MQTTEKTLEQWREMLDPEQYRVCRLAGTERPFTGKYNTVKTTGIYHCICCDAALFDSHAKFDSGCGWPSFYEPIGEQAVVEVRDTTHGMIRTEVRCASCNAHLGHVFPDGPPPTGLRYCINSVCLQLVTSEGERV
ncbi:peptide-methionine (R)-S-oxide reductase MsrB [Pseudomonas sp. RIT-PI-S]|uniref:peptide-methionine (R)-S-oxide reductase MsrB n=1 Tax=Pseudomonas sp. RIT-PI-S TaxID=3035295 RepID=UPI0021DAA221|nr:peptide-methionine (R)-S-oxide reductase MsrB [Pseudomonas sp. RIT-PI-S]